MAAHELTGEQEGLLFDFEERLIEGTRSNVLLLEQGKWVTPDLEQVGVKGTLRQFLLELGAPLDLREAHISHQRLLAADAIFMVNGLFGVWPVCELDGQVRVVPPAASEALRQQVQTVLGYPQGLEVSRPPQIV
jgi:4-amino-4-deoxychorismate lyase